MARLSAGTLAVAVVAVLLALTGAFAVRQFLEQRTEVASVPAPASEPDLVVIPVAVTDLEQGRVIRESDFSSIKMLRSEFAKSKYAQKAFVNRVEQLKGRILRDEIAIGSTVGPAELYAEGTGPTVADKLPEGMRAVTVKVSGSGFVDGFATPGTKVDVLFRSSADEVEDIPETTITALQGIQVLAVDATPYPMSVPESNSSRNTPVEEVRVTFAVLPAEATMLKALEDRGEISLSLRPELGDAVVKVGSAEEPKERHAQTLISILEGAEAPLVAVATTELTQGRVVRQGDIRLIETPVGLDSENETTYSNVESLVGRVLRRDISSGSVMTAALLYPEGVNPGVADRLPLGFRAITIKMDQAALVDGFVSPGTKVDVFFRANRVEGYPETTLRVLDGLNVLAIEDRVAPGAAVDQDNDDVRVTLAVPLGDVGKIQALEGHGVMTLAVRATEERPVGEIARELDRTSKELEKTLKQIAALKEISRLDDSISLSKEQTERLSALIEGVPMLERRLEALSEERNAATSGVSQTTLAEVLNLPEPSLPAKLEIYKGGSRETLVFNSSQQALRSSRTASRQPAVPAKVKNTSVKTKASAPISEAGKPAVGGGVEKVSLVAPERKVSAVRKETPRSEYVTWGQRRDSQGTSILTSVKDFGKELVAGLSQARQSAPSVEIVRGGVKD